MKLKFIYGSSYNCGECGCPTALVKKCPRCGETAENYEELKRDEKRNEEIRVLNLIMLNNIMS